MSESMNIERFSPVKDVLRTKIITDPGRFQGRETDFSSDTVKAIVAKGYYDRSASPIKVWWDDLKDKYVVLAGHSRLAAWDRIHTRYDLSRTIPVIVFQGDEDDAMDYAIIESNRKSTEEGIASDLRAYRRAVESGKSKKYLLSVFKPESKLAKLQKLIHLNPKGRFIEMLSGTSALSFPYLDRNAQWVGDMRSQLPQLSDAHELELFKYIYDGGKGLKLDKAQLYKVVNDRVNRIDFDPTAALNLENRVSSNAYVDPINEEIANVTKEIERSKKEIDDKRATIVRAKEQFGDIKKGEGYKLTSPIFKRIDDLNRFILRKIEEREKLKQQAGRVERTVTADLFSEPEAPKQKTEEFRKPLQHLLSKPNTGRASLMIGDEKTESTTEKAFTYTTRGTVKKTHDVNVEVLKSKNGKRYLAKDNDGLILAGAFVDNNDKITGVITDVGSENVGIGTNLIREIQSQNPNATPDELTSKQGERLAERVVKKPTTPPFLSTLAGTPAKEPVSESELNKKSPFVKYDNGFDEYDGMFSKNKTGTGDISEAITDDVDGKKGYFFFQKGKQVKIIMMSPDQYLARVRDAMKMDEKRQEQFILDGSKKNIKEGIDKGDKIDMPYLDYRRGFGQEGRNRAVVAKERGEKLIPVAEVTEVSFEEKEAKADEIVKQAIKKVGDNQDAVKEYLQKEAKLHRDAVRFITENSKAYESLSTKKEQTKPFLSTLKGTPVKRWDELKKDEVVIIDYGGAGDKPYALKFRSKGNFVMKNGRIHPHSTVRNVYKPSPSDQHLVNELIEATVLPQFWNEHAQYKPVKKGETLQDRLKKLPEKVEQKTGNYYVTNVFNDNLYLLLGPFNAHQDAINSVQIIKDHVMNVAQGNDIKQAVWGGYGTTNLKTSTDKGTFNDWFAENHPQQAQPLVKRTRPAKMQASMDAIAALESAGYEICGLGERGSSCLSKNGKILSFDSYQDAAKQLLSTSPSLNIELKRKRAKAFAFAQAQRIRILSI